MNPFAFLDERLRRLREPMYYFILLCALATFVMMVLGAVAIDEERNFLVIACDTAAFQSTLANSAYGDWFRDTAYNGPNYLGLHCIPILIPLTFLHVVFPSPEMLFILQVVGVYGTVYPLYFLALELTRRSSLAFLYATTAVFCPLFLNMAMAPFHPESWILPACFWTYYFYRRNNLIGFCISLGLGLSCSEQATVIFIALGMALLVRPDGLAWRLKYGAMAFGSALLWLIICVGLIIPQMRGPSQANLMAYNYSNLGVNSVTSLFWAVIRQPSLAAGFLFSGLRWVHVLTYVGLPLLMAIFSLRSLVLLLPFAIYFLMSDQEFALTIHAYYFQFAFLAGYLGFLFTLARCADSGRLAFLFCGAVFFFNLLLLIPATIPYLAQATDRDEDFASVLHEAFDAIPVEAGVFGPHRYSAYLSDRRNMVMGDLGDPDVDFDAMIDDEYVNTTVHSSDIDFIVCDVRNDQCGPRMDGFDAAKARVRSDNLARLVKSGEWQVAWNQQDVVILRRATPAK